MTTWQDDIVPDSEETTPEVTTHSAHAPTAVPEAGPGTGAAQAVPAIPVDDELDALPSGEPLDVRPATASPETDAHHDDAQQKMDAQQGMDAQQQAAVQVAGEPAEGTSPASDPVSSDPVAPGPGGAAVEAGGRDDPGPVEEPAVPETPTWRRFDLRTQREEGLAAAQAAIAAGECIVLPTDTVYGIGSNAFSAEAVQRLLDAKHRGRDMPPPVLISDPAMLQALGADLETYAERLAEECWPGALTLIVTMQPSLRVDLGDTRGTIGLRVPDHEEARELLRRTGPLAVSSANVSGRPSSTNIEDAIEQLGNSVSVYLDAGPTPGDAPSTIIDFVSATFGRIVRQGALGLEAIREVDPFVEEYVDPHAPAEPDGVHQDAGAVAEAEEPTVLGPDATAPGEDPDDRLVDAADAVPTSEQVVTDAAAAQVAEHTDPVPTDADHTHPEHTGQESLLTEQVDPGSDDRERVGSEEVAASRDDADPVADAAGGTATDGRDGGADHPVH